MATSDYNSSEACKDKNGQEVSVCLCETTTLPPDHVVCEAV